jgi:predicted NBD/HSP70 family sugar kinase
MSDRTLAVDIGGSKLMAGVVAADGAILAERRLALTRRVTGDEIVDHVARLYDPLVEEAGGPAPTYLGVSVPGLADPSRGLWIYAPFSGISDYPICEKLTARLGLEACCENDVNSSAIAERRYGISRDVDNYLWVTVSNGVGGGLFLDGHLYRGAFGFAGEIGHMVIDRAGTDGELVDVESLVAGPALVRRYAETCGGRGTGEPVTPKIIAERALRGDVIAQELYRSVGEYLGIAIATAVNLLNPEMVVLGGGISCAFDLFQDALISTVARRIFNPANGRVCIRKSKFPAEAALLGAAAVALDAARRTR